MFCIELNQTRTLLKFSTISREKTRYVLTTNFIIIIIILLFRHVSKTFSKYGKGCHEVGGEETRSASSTPALLGKRKGETGDINSDEQRHLK